MGTVLNMLDAKLAAAQHLNKVAKAKALLKKGNQAETVDREKLAACLQEIDAVCQKYQVKQADMAQILSALRGAGRKAVDIGGQALAKGKELGARGVEAAKPHLAAGGAKVKELAAANPNLAAALGAGAVGGTGAVLGAGIGKYVDQPINRAIHGEQVDTNPNFIGSLQRSAPAIEGATLGTIGAGFGAELASPGSLGRAAGAVGRGAGYGLDKAKALLGRLRGIRA